MLESWPCRLRPQRVSQTATAFPGYCEWDSDSGSTARCEQAHPPRQFMRNQRGTLCGQQPMQSCTGKNKSWFLLRYSRSKQETLKIHVEKNDSYFKCNTLSISKPEEKFTIIAISSKHTTLIVNKFTVGESHYTNSLNCTLIKNKPESSGKTHLSKEIKTTKQTNKAE